MTNDPLVAGCTCSHPEAVNARDAVAVAAMGDGQVRLMRNGELGAL